MSVNFPGEQPESVRIKSSSECVCGHTECVCVTGCALSVCDSVYSKPYTPTVCDNGEGSGSDSAGNACGKEGTGHNVFAEETIGKKSKGSSYGSGKASVCAKEWVLLVEKEGFATVVMYPEQRTAHVFLADGTVVTGSSHGAYEVGG